MNENATNKKKKTGMYRNYIGKELRWKAANEVWLQIKFNIMRVDKKRMEKENKKSNLQPSLLHSVCFLLDFYFFCFFLPSLIVSYPLRSFVRCRLRLFQISLAMFSFFLFVKTVFRCIYCWFVCACMRLSSQTVKATATSIFARIWSIITTTKNFYG